MRSFSSQEDLLDNELYDLAPESPDELAGPQESERAEVSTADHRSEIPVDSASPGDEEELTTEGQEIEPGDQVEASPQDETIMDYEADDESDGELNDTVVAAQGAQPSVVGAGAIETMHIVHPNGELNHPVAVTTDKVLEVMEEQVPHANLSPEAIVNEVEAEQVVSPMEPNGACSIVSCPNIIISLVVTVTPSCVYGSAHYNSLCRCYAMNLGSRKREAIVSCVVMFAWESNRMGSTML